MNHLRLAHETALPALAIGKTLADQSQNCLPRCCAADSAGVRKLGFCRPWVSRPQIPRPYPVAQHACQLLVGGFEEAAKQLGVLSIIAGQAGNWDRLTAMNITMATLKVHPDLKAIYAASDTMALGAAEAVASSSAAGKVMIIGTGGIPSALDTIEEGRMAGTVDLDPGTMGRLSVESVIATLEGVKIPPNMASQVKLITWDNL